MTLTLTLKKLKKTDLLKVVKVFLYAALSLGLAVIPVHFAHNPAYITLAAPINAVLVGLRQTVKQEEASAIAALPLSEQVPVENAVNTIEQGTGQLPVLPTPPTGA